MTEKKTFTGADGRTYPPVPIEVEENMRAAYEEQNAKDDIENKVTYKGKKYTIIERRADGRLVLEGLNGEIVGPTSLKDTVNPRGYAQQELASIVARDMWEHGGHVWRTDKGEWWMIPETSESKTWSRDDTLSAERHIKSTLLRVHPGVTQTTATSIEKWARETLNRPAEVWDKHPWLLAVQNGVINLQTGELHDGDPHLYLTRAAPFAYHPELNDADCPRWIKHQDMLFNGDADVIHTVHKMFGAALIGDATNIKPQAYLFIQGESGSGKGVELRMLAHVLGSFAENFKAADFEEKSNDRHHQWMTRLKGARLALVEEVPAGTLNVQLLKTLSGGDKQIANMMRQNDETWMPTHTLIFSSNLAPNFNNDIEGQLRRYVPLPTGPRRKPAAGYEQQLQDEAEAVLAWLVRGCRIWVEEDGGTFDPDTLPDSIKAVRDSHISDNDPYSPFIETNIIVTGDAADGFGRSALRIVFGKWLVERGDFKPLADKDPRLSRLADKLRTTPGVTEVPHIGSSRERGWRGVVWRDEVT